MALSFHFLSHWLRVMTRRMTSRHVNKRTLMAGLLGVSLLSLIVMIGLHGNDRRMENKGKVVARAAAPAPPHSGNTLPPSFQVITECSQEQNQRQQHLLDVCRTFKRRGLNPEHSPNQWLRNANNIFVLESQKAIFCFVPHSSSLLAWKHKLLSDMGVFPEMDIDTADLDWVAKVNEAWDDMHVRLGFRPLSSYKRPQVDYLTTHYFKFITVRHPLARLYSDYREKILDPVTSNDTYFHSKISDIRKAFQDSTASTPLTYELFVKDLIASYPHLDGMHTKMAIDYCDPCAIYYNFIIKYETQENDTQCLLQHLNLSPYFPSYRQAEVEMRKAENMGRRLLGWLQDDILLKEYDIFGYS